MSLDVYLTIPPQPLQEGSSFRLAIFVREHGQTIEISRKEFQARHPDREPVVVVTEDCGEVFHANITHNLTAMAEEAGIYAPLWRPDELGVTKARELIEPLTKGLKLMRSNPDRFKTFNPSNGWGSYDVFLPWIKRYVEACRNYPDAEVSVSR